MHCAARRESTPHGRAGLPGKWQGQITHEDRRSLALAELYVPPKLLRRRPRHIASVVLEDQGVAARRDHEELADHRRRQGPWSRHSLTPEWIPLRPPPGASLVIPTHTLPPPQLHGAEGSQNSTPRGRDELRGPLARRGQWLGGKVLEEAHPSRRRARPPNASKLQRGCRLLSRWPPARLSRTLAADRRSSEIEPFGPCAMPLVQNEFRPVVDSLLSVQFGRGNVVDRSTERRTLLWKLSPAATRPPAPQHPAPPLRLRVYERPAP